MSFKGKKTFARAMLANGEVEEFQQILTVMKREAGALDLNIKPSAKSKKDNNSVVFTIMSVLNATLGQRELLPVKLGAALFDAGTWKGCVCKVHPMLEIHE